MFPGGGSAAPAPDADEVVEPKNNRKALIVVGAVVAALVVVAGLWLLMSSGASDDSGDDAVVPQAAAGAPNAAPTAAPSPAVVKPASLTVSKRDPFAPLYPTPVSTPAASETAASGGGETAAPSPSPVVPAVTLEVRNIDANKDVATVSVDGKKYAGLHEGDSFGGHYTLYSVFNAQCVGVLYGDQSVPVCLNKPVSVTP
jgi:hypothetical protein